MVERAHVIFQGKVQGVFFRANTEKKALEIGVQGWVRNLPDSTVEAVFEGERQQVQQVIDWCATSQPYAQVMGKEVQWSEPQGEQGFRIIR